MINLESYNYIVKSIKEIVVINGKEYKEWNLKNHL